MRVLRGPAAVMGRLSADPPEIPGKGRKFYEPESEDLPVLRIAALRTIEGVRSFKSTAFYRRPLDVLSGGFNHVGTEDKVLNIRRE